jgi:hypothetical protein
MEPKGKNSVNVVAVLVSLFVALALGFIVGRVSASSSRYQLVVLPAEPGSKIGLDRLYRLDTKTGQIDWLSANFSGEAERTRTLMSWPPPSK